MVLVDDGSSDRTYDTFLATLHKHGADGIAVRHAKSCGQNTALLTGVRNARSQYIVTIDGDGQNSPADIPRMVAMLSSIQQMHFLRCRLPQTS